MESFYLKRHKHRRKTWRFPLVIITCLLLITILFQVVLYPRVFSVTVAKITTVVTSRVQNAVFSVLQTEGYSYEDFVHISTRGDGSVSHMSVDSVNLNIALYDIAAKIIQMINESNRILETALPMGTLLGMELFGGLGPDIPIRVLVEEGVHACFRSEFSTQGINQTLHTVYFSIKIHGQLLFAGGTKTVDLSQEILAAQTVILGDVPDSFTHISRLTADVSEEEIDDIFDFGQGQ